MQQQWHLMKGNVLLGRLTGGRVDQPFYIYDFKREPAFDDYEPLFAAELRSLNKDDMNAWVRDYQRIENLGLTLVAPDGAAIVSEFILHVDNREAWFRIA